MWSIIRTSFPSFRQKPRRAELEKDKSKSALDGTAASLVKEIAAYAETAAALPDTSVPRADEEPPQNTERIAPIERSKPKDDERTAQVFLAMLGDQALRRALADALPPSAVSAFSMSAIDDENALVIDALTEIGCEREKLRAGKKAAACD